MVKHIIEAQQLDQELLYSLFKRADELRKKRKPILKGKILTTLFYEPSTRTRLSFEAAMLALGGSVMHTENAKEFSSVAKGESLEDTIRVVAGYSDVIVLRHNEEGSAKKASMISKIPIINGGDGKGQHPTQTILDLYTIYKELGKIDGVSIAMVGDLKTGRTVRSLCYLLGKFKNVTIYFISPKNLSMGEDIKFYLKKHNICWKEEIDLRKAANQVDIIYMTRIQKERMENEEYNKAKGKYVINQEILEQIKKSSIIMHPLPHVEEIDLPIEIEENDKRVAYFRQAENGLYIRMAILEELLRK